MVDGATTGSRKTERSHLSVLRDGHAEHAPILPGSRDGIGAPANSPAVRTEEVEDMKKAETFLPEDFETKHAGQLTTWLAKEYPLVDAEKTLEYFRDWAEDKGVTAVKWTAKFKRVIRTGIRNKWPGIVTYRKTAVSGAQWEAIVAEAREYGFRQPKGGEGLAVYRSELEYFKKQPKPQNVIEFARKAG